MYSLPPVPTQGSLKDLAAWLQQTLWEMVRDGNSAQLTSLMQQPWVLYRAFWTGTAVNGPVSFTKGNNVQSITRTALGVYRVKIYNFDYRGNILLDLNCDITRIPQETDTRRFAEVTKFDADEFDIKIYRQYYDLPNGKLLTDPWDPVGVTVNMMGLSTLYDGAVDMVNVP